MDLGSILIVLALAVLVVAFVARPLIAGSIVEVSDEERQSSALLAAHDQVVAALVELDSDYAMGKLLSEDYTRDREAMVARGAHLLRQLDGAQPAPASEPVDLEAASEDADLEAAIEARVARVRKGSGAANAFCGQCGSKLEAGDRFCPRCGTPVPALQEPA